MRASRRPRTLARRASEGAETASSPPNLPSLAHRASVGPCGVPSRRPDRRFVHGSCEPRLHADPRRSRVTACHVSCLAAQEAARRHATYRSHLAVIGVEQPCREAEPPAWRRRSRWRCGAARRPWHRRSASRARRPPGAELEMRHAACRPAGRNPRSPSGWRSAAIGCCGPAAEGEQRGRPRLEGS